jgi:mannose-6-phosphate isomerase-like protein (cupin superfamily)
MSMTEVIDIDSPGRFLFEGGDHQDVPISLIVVSKLDIRVGPELHVHPYAEVFVVHEGEATFTVGDETIVAVGGQIVIAPNGRAHKFINTGSTPLRMTCVHPRARVEAEQLGG